MILLAVSQAAIGAVALLVGGGGWDDWHGRTYTVAAWALLIVLACGLNRWLSLSDIYTKQEPGKLLTVLEGAGATITVHQRGPTDRVISINGVNVAGTNPVLRRTQKLQAHLPVCLHPSPRSVLQIGFGSGGTCYSVSLHSEVESIEVIEINPDVLKIASAWFGDVHNGVLHDPRVRTRIVDAKSYVAVTEETYDLILSDSTHPRFRGNAGLYARDYIANCSRSLRPGGILSTWLPIYGLSVDDLRGILKSFQSVFPHVQVWYENFEPHENTIVIASMQPIAIDPAALARRLADSPVMSDLADVGINSALQMLDFFMLGDDAVAEFSRSGRLSTDDHPRLEFLAPKSLRRKQSLKDNFAALCRAREPIDAYLVGARSARTRPVQLAGMRAQPGSSPGKRLNWKGWSPIRSRPTPSAFGSTPTTRSPRSGSPSFVASTLLMDRLVSCKVSFNPLYNPLRLRRVRAGAGKQRPPPLSGSAGTPIFVMAAMSASPSRIKTTQQVS